LSEKTTEDEILELIALIDKKFEKKILDTLLHSSYNLALAVIFVMLILVEIYLWSTHDIGKQLSIAIPFSALIIVFFAMVERSLEDTLIRRSYERLGKDAEENQKPLLKALIKMKVKNPKFNLEQIYNMNKSMFSKEKLLERLYE